MHHVPMQQSRHRHRRRLERPVPPALARRDMAHQIVFQHLLEKRRRGVAAGKIVLHDHIEHPLGQHAAAGRGRLVAKIKRQCGLRDQPALLGRERRRRARARLMGQHQGLRLAANAGPEGGMRQNIVRTHRHRQDCLVARLTRADDRLGEAAGTRRTYTSEIAVESRSGHKPA
jgi:hypothetical protein